MASSIPYIGSKISLVSNSDIRYEGILYTINTTESTIALQSVTCCGTEGRKVPEIPPSREMYDFIIFRGQDIKDLTVLESANPALSAQLNDPAIMSVNQRPPGSAAAGKASSGGKGVSSPSPGGGYGGGYSGGKGSGTWGGGWQKPDNRSGSQAYKGGGGGGYNAWGNDAYGGGSGGGGGGKAFGGKPKGGVDGAKGGGKGIPKGVGKDKGFKGGDKGCGKDKGGGGGKPCGKGGGKVVPGKGSGKMGPQGGPGGGSGGGRRTGGGAGGAGDGVGGTPVGELLPQVNEAEKSKYTEEFDYEGENKKFDQVLKDVEGDDAVDDKLKPLSGYDKGKSFFDNISCEATERAGDAERPKVDRNKARQSDRETFGDTRRPPRPTGGRRGKGGRKGAPWGYRS